MAYPNTQELKRFFDEIKLYADLQHEYGAKKTEKILAKAEKSLNAALAEIKRLPMDQKLAAQEPNSLSGIQALRPKGPRRLWKTFKEDEYAKKIEGALYGRMAGCILGCLVEGWDVERMEDTAKAIGDKFPPVDYWTQALNAYRIHYGMSKNWEFTRSKMNGVPVDDDIIYTLLGLLVLEDFGPNFTMEENGKAWVKYLPRACTAEEIALKNLKKKIPAKRAGAINNPYCEWIGADIRSDPWAYAAPGWPERAAEMAYRDAYLTHRRNGIYGEMYFSAAISAAFAVDDPVEALKIGLTEIPRECHLAKEIRWALHAGKTLRNYRDARAAVDERFKGMHPVHTINNACLTVFGIMIGGTDYTKVISETVAMGLDNDCTAATAGSLVGAIVGKKGIAPHWYRRFNNTIHSYLTGKRKFTISGVLSRFEKQARITHEKG